MYWSLFWNSPSGVSSNVRIMSFPQGGEWAIQCRILNVCFHFFQRTLKSDLKEAQFTQDHLFWVKAPLWYLEGAPSFKTRPWLKNITITTIQNSTLNSSFDALSKWHGSDLDDCAIFVVIRTKWVINICPIVQFFFVWFRFDQKKCCQYCYFEEY